MNDKPMQAINGLWGTIVPLILAGVSAAGSAWLLIAEQADPGTPQSIFGGALALATAWLVERVSKNKSDQAQTQAQIDKG